MTTGPVYHLTTPAAWAVAQRSGQVVPDGFADEGFVHCSTASQVASTIERHFPGARQLLLLELDPASLGDDLRWEEGRPGEVYPHLYRAIDVDEVRRVIPWPDAPDEVTTPA